MKLLDTCVWLEYAMGGPLGTHYKPLFANMSQVVVPTIVQFELFKIMLREKGDELAAGVMTVTEMGHVKPVTTAIAIAAGELALKHKLASMDALILATAYQYRVPLVTCDAHFKGLPGVELTPKN